MQASDSQSTYNNTLTNVYHHNLSIKITLHPLYYIHYQIIASSSRVLLLSVIDRHSQSNRIESNRIESNRIELHRSTHLAIILITLHYSNLFYSTLLFANPIQSI